MSSILISQGVVLATAMAVSGAFYFLSVFLDNNLFPSNQKNPNPPNQALRSCLSSGGKSRERKEKRKKTKRVQFAANVKDTNGNGEEFRNRCRKTSPEIRRSCGTESSLEIPANRVALYSGMLRDREERMVHSY